LEKIAFGGSLRIELTFSYYANNVIGGGSLLNHPSFYLCAIVELADELAIFGAKYHFKNSRATGVAAVLPSTPSSIKTVITIVGLSKGAKPVNQACGAFFVDH
jgi:hypothetical protein